MNKNAMIALTLCGLFLFYKYIAQLFPSLIGTELMRVYGYDGVMLAVLASSYYYSYTFMQIVAGLIIDRYSVRLPMLLALLTISIMLIVFTHTNNFYLMCLSRAFMGVGAAFATVLYMKCAACYTTPKTFGLISSFLATATMLGAACGSVPVGLLFSHVGWQNGLNLVAGIGMAMVFAVMMFKGFQSAALRSDSSPTAGANLKKVLTNKSNWLLLIYSGLTFSPVAILGGLWGVPFLMAKYHVTIPSASWFLTVMFMGLAVGAPIWALISTKMNRKKEFMHFANVIAFLALITILYVPVSYFSTVVLFFIFGFSIGCFMLSFELCRAFNGIAVMGLSVAFINSGEGIVGSILEPFIGRMLDIYKVGETFSLENYQMALSVLPLCFVLSSIILSLIKIHEPAYDLELNAEAACEH